MIQILKEHTGDKSRILDPAAGPGTFYISANRAKINYKTFDLFEIDPRLVSFLRHNLNSTDLNVISGDFLTYPHKNPTYDAAIMNPPYLRHELIETKHKKEVNQIIFERTATRLTKRANYYAYFVLLTTSLLKVGGVMGAIIYDSMKSTKYGQELENFLSTSGRFIYKKVIPTPFENQMIDAQVIFWEKYRSKAGSNLKFETRATSSPKEGFCFLDELALVKRGTSFLKRDYFVTKNPTKLLPYLPMLTKQLLDKGLVVEPNTFGLFKTDNSAMNNKIVNKLVKIQSNSKLENISSLPSAIRGTILFNYYIRDHARHLWNEGGYPASDNFYCVTPRYQKYAVVHWVISNSQQFIKELTAASRLQGSGLRKLQLFEYVKCLFPDYRKFNDDELKAFDDMGNTAIKENWHFHDLQSYSTRQLAILGYSSEEEE